MFEVKSDTEMQSVGERFGRLLQEGDIIELVGDVGAGKTTFVRGLARGMGIEETIQSPSFTINRIYDAPEGMRLVHYDFYRLNSPGIMVEELREALNEQQTAVIIEWAAVVGDVLPADRLTISITAPTPVNRQLIFHASGERSERLMQVIS